MQTGATRSSWLKVGGTIFGLFIALLVLVRSLEFFWAYQTFVWIFNVIRSSTGLDRGLAYPLAVFCTVVFYLSIPSIVVFLLTRQRLREGFLILGVGLPLLLLLLYVLGRGVYFDPLTGAPVKYYHIDRTGNIEIASQDGFDPKTGDRLRPVTRDIALKYEEQRRSPRGGGVGGWMDGISHRGLFWGLGGFLLLATLVSPIVQERAIAKAAWRSTWFFLLLWLADWLIWGGGMTLIGPYLRTLAK